MQKIPVGIIGVSGYTGLELVKILLAHPVFTLAYCAGSEGCEDISNMHRSLAGICKEPVHVANMREARECCELLFLALPHKKAMECAKEALALGLKVVDLSADYRLRAPTYEQHYTEHIDKENLEHAVYGLVEWQRALARKARLVANPGCYPTASLLGILPFAPYIDPQSSVYIDAKSGTSGAGKNLSNNTHFATINENLFAYSPLSHRHEPEIAEKLELFGKCSAPVRFIPHLVPLTRGMLASVFVRLLAPIDAESILRDCYLGEKFIRIRNEPVRIKDVAGTHFCDIFVQQKGKDLWINTAIDNLLRGASSQAVANANLMCGLDDTLGLPMVAYVP